MKKTYIIPSAKPIVLNAKESMLIGNSIDINEGSGDVDGGFTQKQNQQGGNSLWDTWSN